MRPIDITVAEPTASAPAGFLRVTPNVTTSQELDAIVMQHLPTWLRQFASKNADYGGGAAFDLGIRGQYSDIHRKVIKLKKYMWDNPDAEPEFEDVPEIIRDLIGHLFLTLEMMRRRDLDLADPSPLATANFDPHRSNARCDRPQIGRPPHCGDNSCRKLHCDRPIRDDDPVHTDSDEPY